uniref:Uncharacterized protein n=1 Tax=Meloidogyne enterolobii TaxID=390850 RepID=A0A6V7WM93_MELEN|nr:unnamed protein product [Meloidogyne enterolobii]
MELLSKKGIQLPAIYQIRPENGPRICQECIDEGFCKTHYSNGIEIQWNGFMLFYNGDYKTTDVILDIAGHRQIHSTLKSNDFWKNVSKNGVRLEQVIGHEILEKDVHFWDEKISEDFLRSNYVKKINLDQCLEVVYRSQCSYFTSTTDYDDYSCNCGFPVSQKPKSAVKNDRVNKTIACCNQHHGCIAVLANCTGIPALKNYIKNDKNLCHHEKDHLV